MKIRFLVQVCLGTWLIAIASGAADVATPPTEVGDADWQAFAEARIGPMRVLRQGFTPADLAKAMEARAEQMRETGLAFLARHPEDPRRWRIVLSFSPQIPRFVRTWGPSDENGVPSVTDRDEAAAAIWEREVTRLQAEMRVATDVPVDVHEQLDWTIFAGDFRAATMAAKTGKDVDWSAFRTRFDAHVERYNELSAVLVKRADDYLGALDLIVPGGKSGGWATLATSSANQALRARGLEIAHTEERMAHPLEMAFTAVDGCQIDLAQLRGKVVLIDFWATWCGPCVAELPNVKKVYADYHERGFEVVGVALENGRLSPGDTADERSAKLAKAQHILTDFTQKNAMPWPQYFDGKWWKNDISVGFGIRSIPAMFLLDQTGKVVSTEARGEKLEAEVKRLLGL